MCGIYSFLNIESISNMEALKHNFYKGQKRGPEHSAWKRISEFNIIVGFHRLAINGLNPESSQPLMIDDCLLICNGEIYNYNKLYETFDVNPARTNSDCEIIIHMYKKYGIEYTLNNLDGVFAFILLDTTKNTLFVSRDPYGVRPLYQLYNTEQNPAITGFASELKQLSEIKAISGLGQRITKRPPCCDIQQFTPGTYSTFVLDNDDWCFHDSRKYSCFGFYTMPTSTEYNTILKMIRENFINAVKKRVVGTTDRPIACLLSGGLDSSLVTSIVSSMVPNLETYSIGLPGSEDLKYARQVASFLSTNHHQITVTEDELFDAIPHVIYNIESYDTTTVRASVGNYLVAKFIAENSDAKVIFNGDGSDELMGGYLYFHAAENDMEFDKECKRLLSDIHYFDVLRSDRSISSNGLEPRTPFLDRSWVEFYLSIPKNLRCHGLHKKCEKYLIREAFNAANLEEKTEEYLPESILFRTKEAFSDGVSSIQKSWHQIIDEKVKTRLPANTHELFELYKNKHNPPKTLEQLYYRLLFDGHFPKCETTIPYFWMPRFVEATDSSARTLKMYKEINYQTEI